MPITVYDAFVPTARQIVGSMANVLAKAEKWCAETGTGEAVLAAACLHETMLPLPFQIKSVAHHSLGAIEAVRSGSFDAFGGEMPETFAGMKDLLARAEKGLAAVTPEELEAAIGRETVFAMRETKIPFVAEQFLLSFSQPNFFFHAATAYDILRAKGVPLGKRDFLGQLRVQM